MLDRAQALGRLLFTQDDDLLKEAAARQHTSVPFAGVVYAQKSVPIGQIISDLEIIVQASGLEDVLNDVSYATPGQRTVTVVLRVTGLSTEAQFQNYHRVLNRARWSSRALRLLLLRMLLRAFVPDTASIVVGLDGTIERLRCAQIAAKGIYHDPVQSSATHLVKTSGL